MEINLIWTLAPGKKPKTTEEKKVRKAYNLKHDLCFVCDSADHSAKDCPDSWFNKNKTKGKA